MLQFSFLALMISLTLGYIPATLAADLPARAAGPVRPAVATPSSPRPMAAVQSGNAGKKLGDEMECLLEPHLVANVGSPVEGTLSQVLVDRGAQVVKGQVIARLNSSVEAANLNLRKAQEEFGKRKVERNVELFRKELISASEKDEIETQTRIAELEVIQQQQVLDQRAIRSPLEGVVVERYLAPGERVANEKILRIAQVNPLNVEVIAPVELFGSIKQGMAADVSLEPLLSGAYKAKVVVVDRVIDAASGTFGVRLELPNQGNRIPAGIKCRLRFNPR
jgi:membrane fusion protein (multidrug efflux system)